MGHCSGRDGEGKEELSRWQRVRRIPVGKERVGFSKDHSEEGGGWKRKKCLEARVMGSACKGEKD